MKVYLTYSPSYHDLLLEEGCRRVMVSFGTQRRLVKPALPNGFEEYLLDSGGYQAIKGTAQRPLYVLSYCHWVQDLVNRYGDKIAGYMAPDYGNKDITFENYLWMQYQGLTPIPILKPERGEPWDESLLALYCRDDPYVAVGGLAGSGVKAKQYYRDLAEKTIAKYPRVKFHFLGVGINAGAFNDTKPYSVDSMTWMMPVVYGTDIIPEKDRGLKEVPLPQHLRQRIREIQEYSDDMVRKAIRYLLSLERR